MRHRVVRKILGRDAAHRNSLIKNLATSLVENGKITTTLPKAKFVRSYVEKLITRAKKGKDFNNIKYLKNKLTTDEAVRVLLDKIAPSLLERKGGYTKIARTGYRDGDNALMSRIEIIQDIKETKPARRGRKATTKKEEITKTISKEKAAKTQENINDDSKAEKVE